MHSKHSAHTCTTEYSTVHINDGGTKKKKKMEPKHLDNFSNHWGPLVELVDLRFYPIMKGINFETGTVTQSALYPALVSFQFQLLTQPLVETTRWCIPTSHRATSRRLPVATPTTHLRPILVLRCRLIQSVLTPAQMFCEDCLCPSCEAVWFSSTEPTSNTAELMGDNTVSWLCETKLPRRLK